MEKDSLLKLKYMGYCMSSLPPTGIPSGFEDFVRYAKFQLCIATRTLMKDPIWDAYSDEEILVEYFATLYQNKPEDKSQFEASLGGTDADIYDWFDEQIEKNKGSLDKQFPEKISFDPAEVMGE